MNLHAILCTLAACLSLLTPAAHAVTCAAGLSPSNPDAAYTDNADGTVTHLPSGLIWKRCSEGQSWTGSTCTGTAANAYWTQALTQASTSSFAGHSDWRLPNIRELRSLVEECRANPAINDTIFPATPSSNFWSGSPNAYGLNFAWYVSFDDGSDGGYVIILGYPYCCSYYGVRLVRGGQSFDSLNPGADTTLPTLSAVGLSGIGQTSATLTATSDEAGYGYWMVVAAGATAPSAAQVKSLGNYAGVTVVASGSGAMTANVSTNFPVSGLAAGSNYDFYVVATDASANLSATPVKVQGSTPAPATRLINLSTRGQVQTGDNVMIGGFVIGGSVPKTVLVRAVGPNLANYGVPGVLANPKLDLYSGPSVIASNDDWGTASNAAAITASTLAPSSPLESAILTTLAPGAYTAIVSGVGGTSGVGTIEIFEVDRPEYPLVNISTRGQVLTGDNVLIGGFIIQGTTNQAVLIRAGGPTLANYGVTGALANPKLDLYWGPAVIASNDDWGTAANAAAIQTTGLAPVSPLEAAILITLSPGAYTAIVSGVEGGTGVGIVEVFAQ